jgi:hypothetical protein
MEGWHRLKPVLPLPGLAVGFFAVKLLLANCLRVIYADGNETG